MISWAASVANRLTGLTKPTEPVQSPSLLHQLQKLLLPLFLLLLWLLALRYQWAAPQTLPSPGLVAATAMELVTTDLLSHLWISLQRLALGVITGVTLGALLGTLIGLNPHADRFFYTTLIALAQVPNLAWVPLLMIFLGIDEALKFAILFLSALVPMTLNTQTGMRELPPRLREASSVLRLNLWQRIRLLYLPGAAPSMLTGLRLAVASAWTSLIVVELLASSEGIGYLMVWGRQMFQIDIVFVCIFAIGAVALLLDQALKQLEKRAIFWPAQQHTGGGQQVILSRFWYGLLPGLLAIAWLLATSQGWVAPHTLPSPARLLQALEQGFIDGSLTAGLLASMQRAIQGLFWGSLIGLLLGLLAGLWPGADRFFTGTVNVLRQIAIFAWLPLITAWVGTGEAARILFIGMAVFFPVFVSTRQGVVNLPPPLVEAAKVLHLRLDQRLRWLVLPGAASAIFTGLRIAMLYAWLATIGAEYFMASSIGIGSLMINAQQLFQVDLVIACVVLVSLTGALFNLTGVLLQRQAQSWRQH